MHPDECRWRAPQRDTAAVNRVGPFVPLRDTARRPGHSVADADPVVHTPLVWGERVGRASQADSHAHSGETADNQSFHLGVSFPPVVTASTGNHSYIAQ